MRMKLLACVCASVALLSSLSALAITDKEAQSCFSLLTKAQHSVLQNIRLGTLGACKLEANRDRALGRASDRRERIEINNRYDNDKRDLIQKTRQTIVETENSLNARLQQKNCSPPLPTLPLRLERRGFAPPGAGLDAFEFESLCRGFQEEPE